MNPEKVFAIGDVHGCYDELEKLIAMLPLDENSTLVFLGDYVDRGPNSKAVIQKIIDLSQTHTVIALMGNHEAMMLEFLRDPSSPLAGFFILNGGSSTLASYLTQGNQYEVPEQHRLFLKSLRICYQTDSHFFVHAGVPNIKLQQLDPKEYFNEMLWIRQSFLKSTFHWEKIIVHGHTPANEVEITNTRINLDTGCVYKGTLSAMEVNSKTLYQVKANRVLPRVFLKENPHISRAAKRFLGAIPVHIQNQTGTYDEFLTVNYNEFGLLIVDINPKNRIFEVGQVITGWIGSTNSEKIDFVGKVVRQQSKGTEIAYGIQMLEPLGPSYS